MAFLDNLKALQQISDRCDVDTDKLVNACGAISAALDNANNILSDNAAAIATIEADIAASSQSSDPGQLASAALASTALAAARLKAEQTVTRLQAAKSATQSL